MRILRAIVISACIVAAYGLSVNYSREEAIRQRAEALLLGAFVADAARYKDNVGLGRLLLGIRSTKAQCGG